MSRLSESVFNGVAQNLIGRGIPAVVAMQYSISVRAASAFAEEFYYSVGQKDSLVSALRQGQRAIGIEGNEWYRPLLYLRWEDNEGGQLFQASPDQSGKASQDSRLPLVKASENQPSSNALPLNNEQPKKRQLSRFQQLELERLTTELDDLERDYETVQAQLRNELDGATQNKLKRQLEQIGQEIDQHEQQLHQLKQ
jgi:hypothetical protein